MNNAYDLYILIQKYAEEQQGIFSLTDLKNLFNDFNEVSLLKKIKKLQEKSILKKFCRGFYTIQKFNLEALSARINENSYISFGNILSKELVIGSMPKYTVTCVKLGKTRIYRSEKESIIYLTVSPRLFFGYIYNNGVNYAIKEKAFLDTLYYYQKGYKFSFNIFSDINCKLLDKKIIIDFLKKYVNPKYISFVKNYIDEKF